MWLAKVDEHAQCKKWYVNSVFMQRQLKHLCRTGNMCLYFTANSVTKWENETLHKI